MAILDQNSIFSTIEPKFQLPIDEASSRHTNRLGELNNNPSSPSENDLESTNTTLSPSNSQLNYFRDEADSLILLEDTIFSPNESTSFEDTPSLFGLGILQTPNEGEDKLKPALLSIPDKSQFQDLNGFDGGNGFFHGVNNPGKGQGLQVGEEDLHVALLKNKELYNQQSEFQSLDGLEGPKFDFGKEASQDPENPIFDTIHEQSLLAPKGDESDDLDLDGRTPDNYIPNDITHLNQLNQVPGGATPSAYADVNGTNNVNVVPPGGAPIPENLLFHQDKNPTKYKGLQVDGIDLHEHLLQNSYTYTHGLSTINVKPSTSYGDRYHYQDLDIDIRNETPTQYINNLPK